MKFSFFVRADGCGQSGWTLRRFNPPGNGSAQVKQLKRVKRSYRRKGAKAEVPKKKLPFTAAQLADAVKHQCVLGELLDFGKLRTLLTPYLNPVNMVDFPSNKQELPISAFYHIRDAIKLQVYGRPNDTIQYLLNLVELLEDNSHRASLTYSTFL